MSSPAAQVDIGKDAPSGQGTSTHQCACQEGDMRYATAIFIAVMSVLAQASATPSSLIDLASPEAVLRWINAYRAKPDPAGVPAAVRALSRLGAFKDPETSGVFVGFIAGAIGSNPARADELIAKMFPLPASDQWVIVRAIAYSGLPDWKRLMIKFADRMPARKVMIDKSLAGKLPTLWEMTFDKKPSTWETLQGYLTLDGLTGRDSPKKVALEPGPELLDTFWGYYFATGAHRPIWRILAMLPWSKDDNNVEKLTLGSMAKYTLASNAARDAELLAMLKRARDSQPKPVAAVLDQVIDAAETVETTRLRKEALATIDEMRRKGPGSRRNISFWGQVGQGALAVGCIAAAATGHVELGLPCVIGGGLSSAALSVWNGQP